MTQTLNKTELSLVFSRAEIAELIAARIEEHLPELTSAYTASGPVGYFVVDNLLPEALAYDIAAAFPKSSEMKFKSTLRERKYISSQMNQYPQLLEDALFAFHDPRVIALVEKIMGHTPLYADPMLYAGGISCMEKTGFLNPHIDNSHDKERKYWRSLNLLYYISPGWQAHFGGNLELWPHGVKDAPITLPSHFNRLVIMATHHHSLHSVSPIHADAPRNCISNYYFSSKPMRDDQPFHVTAFRGRPEQPVRDMILRGDTALRMCLRKIKSGGFFKTGHWYTQSGQ